MGRRQRIEIFAEILDLARRGAKKTRLVYGVNTNFQTMDRYLEILVEKGLIKSDNGYAFTTEKGLDFLEKYRKLMLVLKSAENGDDLSIPN